MSEIEYKDDNFDLVFHIKEANGYAGIKFSSLQTQGSAALGSSDSEDRTAEFGVYVWTWPACMASTEKVTGKGSERVNNRMTIKDFLDLPWNLIRTWEAASYAENPTFSPFWRLRKRDETPPESGLTES